MLSRLFSKKESVDVSQIHRRDTILTQIDYLIDTLEHSKFDILYMENLKNPLTPDERIYFIQQIDRIESAKNILFWMRTNVKTNTPFWKKFLRW